MGSAYSSEIEVAKEAQAGTIFTADAACDTFRRPRRPLKLRTKELFSALAVSLGLAVVAASGCQVTYGATTFRCNPKANDSCPEGYQCCSDDPAEVSGTKLFSDQNNDFSSSGMCVDAGVSAGLPNGCPVPCNPRWTNTQIEAVCGDSSQALCCQTTELEPEDCIYDVGLACFRPVNGFDTAEVPSCPVAMLQGTLQAAGYSPELARCNTGWGRSDHITHQDPGVGGGGSSCRFFESQGLDFAACVQALTVADQRGYCLQKSPTVQVCPTDLTDAEKLAQGIPLDACTKMNQDMGIVCN